MNKFFIILLSTLFIISCNKEPIRQQQTKSIETFTEYGEIHNRFLTHMLNDYELSNSFISFDSVKKEMSTEINGFISHNSEFELNEHTALQTSEFLIEDNLNDFIKSTYFKDQVRFINESTKIHSLEKKILNELLRGYLNELSWDDYKNIVDELTLEYNEMKFNLDSPEGDLSGVVLSIANHSIQWWTDNPNAYEINEAEIRLIPAWFAADIVGAFAGGALNGLYQMYTTGCSSDNPCDIGGGVLSGALFGSTGAISRVGRWIHKIFK